MTGTSLSMAFPTVLTPTPPSASPNGPNREVSVRSFASRRLSGDQGLMSELIGTTASLTGINRCHRVYRHPLPGVGVRVGDLVRCEAPEGEVVVGPRRDRNPAKPRWAQLDQILRCGAEDPEVVERPPRDLRSSGASRPAVRDEAERGATWPLPWGCGRRGSASLCQRPSGALVYSCRG